MKPLIALSLALAALMTPAHALDDAATGLAVTLPPADFTIEPSAQPGGYAASFGINTVSGKPALVGGQYLCDVGFEPNPQSAAFSQDVINAEVEKPEWADMIASSMGTFFRFVDRQSFTLAGASGVEFTAIPKAPGGEALRIVLSLLETPHGRTTVSCATSLDQFDDALPVFRAIRAGVTPPA